MMREDPDGYDDLEGAYTRLTCAAISMKPHKWAKEANADKLEHFFRRAADTGARLLVAPEGVLEGYVVMEAAWGRGCVGSDPFFVFGRLFRAGRDQRGSTPLPLFCLLPFSCPFEETGLQ